MVVKCRWKSTNKNIVTFVIFFYKSEVFFLVNTKIMTSRTHRVFSCIQNNYPLVTHSMKGRKRWQFVKRQWYRAGFVIERHFYKSVNLKDFPWMVVSVAGLNITHICALIVYRGRPSWETCRWSARSTHTGVRGKIRTRSKHGKPFYFCNP